MLQLGSGVWAATLAQLRSCGAGRTECVTFWTGPAEEPDRVDRMVHPIHTATPAHYAPDPRWLHQFFVDLRRERRSARGQVHTHGFRASHSPTDDAYPLVSTAGFLSLVVPRFAMRQPTPDELFLVEAIGDGSWRRIDPSARIGGMA